MAILTTPPSRAADITVVGAGPVGLAIALEAARRGAKVLLIEAGAVSPQRRAPQSESGEVARVANAAGHAAIEEATRSGLGGTSRLWGGRCVPFEPIDFAERAHVAVSGWPIGIEEVRAVAARAAEYLDCGSASFHTDEPRWGGLGTVRMSQRERWSQHPQLSGRLGRAVANHTRVDILGETVVTGLQFDGDAVVALQARHRGRPVTVVATETVLACGGVKTTRLLLNAQVEQPQRFGGPGGPLGRFYSGHITGSICRITFADPREARLFRLSPGPDGTVTRRRFTIDDAAQRANKLLNTAFFVVNPPFDDPRHRSGPLSLAALLLAVPSLGRTFGKQRQVPTEADASRMRAHLRNVRRQPLQSIATIGSVAYRRYLSLNPRWEFVAFNPTGTYALQYHAEQTARAENRITLNETVGSDGLRDVDVHFDFADQDIRSIVDSHRLLEGCLAETGRIRLDFNGPAPLQDQVRAQASDGYHQIGTVRMSAAPEDGIVDTNLRVHGVQGLSVAGSAVFPTAGEANPTFMAVSLGIRLARSLTTRTCGPTR